MGGSKTRRVIFAESGREILSSNFKVTRPGRKMEFAVENAFAFLAVAGALLLYYVKGHVVILGVAIVGIISLLKKFQLGFYCEKMKKDFARLVKNITPIPQLNEEASRAINTVLEELKQNSHRYGIAIGKVKPAGSFAKNTGIVYENHRGAVEVPDLDLIVFVNDVYPPFSDIYEDFVRILRQTRGTSDITLKTNSVRFYVRTKTQGKLKVDLLVAVNRVKDTSRCNNVAQEEARRTLQMLKQKQLRSIEETGVVDHDENIRWSVSFA